jgi:hypothetical protein
MQAGDCVVIIRRMIDENPTMQSPAVYRVCVQGRVPLDWSSHVMGMNITSSKNSGVGGRTTLVGRLPDQAALSGVLNTLYENQYPVLSVECLEVG